MIIAIISSKDAIAHLLISSSASAASQCVPGEESHAPPKLRLGVWEGGHKRAAIRHTTPWRAGQCERPDVTEVSLEGDICPPESHEEGLSMLEGGSEVSAITVGQGKASAGPCAASNSSLLLRRSNPVHLG